ncbi:NADP-dependent oxidoreductase [Nocardia sp. BMG51109]|uniref:NADP-dependent oxidoreductase n=1 Tax=Nocardia sp. BMG51109 TaxID=1056816 RepID=UPI000464FAE9|nr:NADP-dependent oxidoreductase [Nocardia sp. BMG51109]
MGEKNRQWVLARRPDGHRYADAVELVDGETPDLADGEVLVRNIYFSLDAGTRMWMGPREDSYSPATPLGSPVVSTVLGSVVASRHPDFRSGDLVRAYGQWSDFSVVRPDEVYAERVTRRLADPRQHLGVFGANGWTAYLGVLEYGAAQPGETFVVSAASGVTGALAGQIAKLHGCRVVGITGSAAKSAWLTGELGFDAAIDRGAGDLERALRETCPGGVDVYFDNVGGPVLDSVLGNMALFGRIALCGLLVHYDHDEALPGPARFDQILMKRLTVRGFFSPDFYHRGPDLNRSMRPWYDEGKLRMAFDVTPGIENTLDAYAKLFTGDKIGKSLVQVSDPDD